MSVIRSREVSASPRLFYSKINRGQVICPPYRGSPLFGGSDIRCFTVIVQY